MITYLPHRRSAFRGGGGAFDPIADVTSATCLFYLLAGSDCEVSAGTPCSNNDAVLNWLDKTTASNDFAQTTSGNRPTYIADGGTAWNNEPLVRFDGATSWLLGPNGATMWTGATSGEIFVLLAVDNDPPTGFAYAIGYFSRSTSDDCHPFTDGNVYNGWMSSARKSCGNPAADLTAPHVLDVYSASGDWNLLINNSSLFSTTSNNFLLPNAAVRIATDNDGARFLDGDIKAWIAYDAKLSSDDRTAVYNYLNGLHS